jgi:hypothetical protein
MKRFFLNMTFFVFYTAGTAIIFFVLSNIPQLAGCWFCFSSIVSCDEKSIAIYNKNIILYSLSDSVVKLTHCYFSYHNLLKRGVRIAIRAKVNDSLITGLRVVDCIIPVGRGQRQLILGDRYTGKTMIFLSLLLYVSSISSLVSIDGFGTKRIFGVYIGINQNLSKLVKLIGLLFYIS